jgi:hypothetical protein
MSSADTAAQVLQFVAQFPTVGFSGSRSLGGQPLRCAQWLARGCSPELVVVGCAQGADRVFRERFAGRAQVISADASRGRGGFAARSAAVVQAVAANGGCWVAFPSGECPDMLSPSSRVRDCFCGSGSGSWASLALVVGRGVPCLIYLADGIQPPYWGFESLGCGWWSFTPSVQPSLF